MILEGAMESDSYIVIFGIRNSKSFRIAMKKEEGVNRKRN
jgi:hypothetical protein